MIKSSVLLAFFTLILTSQAHALFEARLTYGLLSSKPDLGAIYTGSSSEVPSIAPNYGVGVDAIFVLPAIGLGFGARYENLGFKISSNGLEYKSSSTRTALILNYRIINTLIFLGPIVTYGISHSNNIKWSVGAPGLSVAQNVAADISPASSSSYTVGVEAGANLLGFNVGVEAGYETFKWNKMTDSNGVLTSTPDLDFGGSYAKVLFGFGI